MKYILKLAIKNTFFNRKKTFAAFVGFFLCALFFSFEITLVYSYAVDNNNLLDNTFGTHNGIYCVEQKGLNEIIRSNYKETGIISVFLISDTTDSTKRTVVAGAFDDTAQKLCRLQVTEGAFPISDDEIMLEKSLMSVMFCGKSIGDKLDISVDGKPYTFTICGIYENISTIQWDSDKYKVPFVNAVLNQDFGKTAMFYFVPIVERNSADNLENIFIFCPNMREIYDAFSAISGMNSESGVVLLILILSLFSIVVMVTLSYINKKSEEKTIGLWKSAGISTKDIFLFYLVKLLITSIPALLIGSVSGYGIGFAFGRTSANVFISLLCFGTAAVVLWVTYLIFIGVEIRKCVVENLNNSLKCKEIHSTDFSTNNPILLYSVKNYILNSKEIAAASISMFFAVFILLISSSIMKNAENYLAESERSYDVLLDYAPYTVTSLNISRYGEAGLSNDEYSLLKEKTAETIGIKTQYVYEITNAPENFNEYDERVASDRKVIGFPDSHIIPSRLLGVDEDTLNLLKKYIVSGSLELDELKDGKNVVLCKIGDSDFTHAVGDKISLGYAINENQDAPSYEEITYHEIEITITALIAIPESDKLLCESIQGGFLWSESAFDCVNIEKNYSKIFTKIGEYESAFYDILAEFKTFYGDMLFVYDYAQDRINYGQFFNSFKTVSLAISVGLSLFSIMNTAITVWSRIMRRKKLFGCLRAVGLTQTQMTGIVFVENCVSATISSVLGVICGLIIIYCMSTPIFGIMYATLLISFNFVCIVLISYVATKKCFSHSVVECVSHGE